MENKQDSKKKLVGILFDEIVHETPKAWLLVDTLEDDHTPKEGKEYSYTISGNAYCKDDAFWFPKSQCKLKNMNDGSIELQLPVWLAEKNEIIDDCYGLDQEDAFPAGGPEEPEAQREPISRYPWSPEDNDIPF